MAENHVLTVDVERRVEIDGQLLLQGQKFHGEGFGYWAISHGGADLTRYTRSGREVYDVYIAGAKTQPEVFVLHARGYRRVPRQYFENPEGTYGDILWKEGVIRSVFRAIRREYLALFRLYETKIRGDNDSLVLLGARSLKRDFCITFRPVNPGEKTSKIMVEVWSRSGVADSPEMREFVARIRSLIEIRISRWTIEREVVGNEDGEDIYGGGCITP